MPIGPHLDRSRRRRQRVLRHHRGPQLRPADGPLCPSRRALHPYHRPRRRGAQRVLQRRRHQRSRLPGHPARRRGAHPVRGSRPGRPEVVRRRVPPLRGTLVARRPAVHDPRAVRVAGPPGRAPDRVGGPGGGAAGRVLRRRVLRDAGRDVVARVQLRGGRHAELHGGEQQLRAGHRGGCRDVRGGERPGARGHRGTADRGSRPAWIGVRREVGWNSMAMEGMRNHTETPGMVPHMYVSRYILYV